MSFDYPVARTAESTSDRTASNSGASSDNYNGDIISRIRALFPNDAPGSSSSGDRSAPSPSPVAASNNYAPGSIQDTIVRAATRHGVDPAVMLGLAQSESGFDPDAVSPTGATGLFQFTKRTAKQYGVDRRDPVSSSDGAARYVKDLLAGNGNDVADALRQYKGVAVGGATEQDVQKTLGTIDTFRDSTGARSNGITAPARTPSSPIAGIADGFDIVSRLHALFPNDMPGGSTNGVTAPAQPTPEQQGPVNFSGVSTATSNDVQNPFAGVSTQTSNDNQNVVFRREMEESKKAYRTAFDQGNVGNVDDRSSTHVLNRPEFLLPAAAREAAAKANTAITSVVKNEIGEEGVAGIKSAIGAARSLDTKIAASPVVQSTLRGLAPDTKEALAVGVGVANTLTGGTGEALFPKTSEAVGKELSTGVPMLDEAIKTGANLATTVLAPEIAISASVAGSGARVATGEETPLAGLAEAVLNLATVRAYEATGAIPNLAKRVLTGAGLGAASETAGALVHGEAPTVGGLAGSVLTGGLLSAGGARAETEEPSPSETLKAKVDDRAHEAATSPMNDRPEPTPAQTEAGNYKKGHVTIQGLGISIENPEGSIRSGVSANGEPWSVTMKDHYGYIKGTTGADGQHLDTFLGPDLKSEKVFVVDQIDPQKAGDFDEHKIVLGANSKDEATEIYKRNYSDDATPRIGAISEVSMPEFKAWLDKGDTAKPFDSDLRKEVNEGQSTTASAPTESTAATGAAPEVAPLERPSARDRSEAGARENSRAREQETSGNAEPSAANERSSTERKPIELADTGTETYMRVGDEKIPVKYALVEARDVQLSHDPITFAKNEQYVGENQNDYEHNKNMQASVERGIADTDWNTIHSQTNTSTEGPTTIDRFGQAAGGNGRGMIQKGVYATRPEEAKSAAIHNADRFGLDPAAAARMQEPMIVRVQPQDVSTSVESRRNIAAHNLSVTKSRTPVEDGVDLAKRFTPENKQVLAGALSNVERLSDLTTDEAKARPVIKVLRDAQQITNANQNDYVTSDATLTNKGRELVEGATIGMAIPDAQLVNKLPSGFRQKLAENLPTLGAVEATEGWELHDNLKRITDYNEARQKFVDRGGVKAMYDKQTSLLPASEQPPALTAEDHFLMKLLEDPKRTKFKEFMQSYAAKAADARAGTIDFSGEAMTRERAFDEARTALNVPERGGIAGYFDKTKAEDNEYIRKNLGKSLSMNVDPELAARLMRRGAAHLVDGLTDFAQWSKQMLDEFGERIKSDLQELYDGAKAQVLAHRGEGIRGAVSELADAFQRPPEKSMLKRIIGDYTGAEQVIDHELAKYAKEIKAALPDKARREAITNYIQADGREDLLLQRAAESSPKYRQGYLDAANLTDKEKDYAQDFRRRMEETWQQAHDAGVLEGHVENYVRGEYERNPEMGEKILATASAGGFNPNPKEALNKIYQSYFDAEKAGLTPKDKDIARQVVANERNLKMAVEARKALAAMMHSVEADGRPTVLVGGMDGRLGTQAEGELDPKAPYLIKPNAVGKDSRGYRDFNHPALRKWKWIADDDAGKAILLQGDMKVHPQAYNRINALLGRSKIRDYTVPERVPVLGGTRPGAAALKVQSFIKGTIMVGPFHQFNLSQEAIAHGDNPMSAPAIDFDARPVLREGVEHGLMLVNHNAMQEFEGEGQHRGLLNHVPVLGEQLDRYQDYLFQDYIPRLKAASFEHWVANAEHRYAGELLSGELTRDQLLDLVARQVNASFGEQNYKYIGRNPTVQDALRLTALAPDFLESRIKHVGQALRPYGREQLLGLVRGGLILAATAQISNVLFSDDKKMNWARPFTFRFGSTEYTPRSAPGDIARAITDPRGFFYYRLNPLFGRPLVEMAEGRNSFGEKIGVGEAAWDILKSWTPIPAQGILKMKPADGLIATVINSLLGSVGITNVPYKSGLEKFVSDRYFDKLPSEKRSAIQTELASAKGELREAYREHASPEQIQALREKYAIPEKQSKTLAKQSETSKLAYEFSQLSLREMAQAFDDHVEDIRALPAKDRTKLQQLFARKIASANPKIEMREEEKAMYRAKYNLAPRASSNALAGVPIQ